MMRLGAAKKSLIRGLQISYRTTEMKKKVVHVVGCRLSTSIEKKLEKHFLQMKMKLKNADNIPLLKSFEEYSKSLPVREYGTNMYLPLYKQQYLARKDAVILIAKRCSETSSDIRQKVKYISAPIASGKTASVLPAFLESTEMVNGGDVYLYIAFSNNGGRHFKWEEHSPNSNPSKAEIQGAAFMSECVKRLLYHPNDPSTYLVKNTFQDLIDYSSSVTLETILNDLQNFINEKFGPNIRIWFHLDEHRKMCARKVESGADFSRGAMFTLARLNNAQVIATYIALPDELLPPVKSSSVCRVGVPLPALDMDQVMDVVPEFHINGIGSTARLTVAQERLYGSLKVRLGLMFRLLRADEFGIASVIHRKGTLSEFGKRFLLDFQQAASTSDVTAALKNCNLLCAKKLKEKLRSKQPSKSPKIVEEAVKLFVGVDDEDILFEEKRFDNLVVLPNETNSLSIETLMTVKDSNIDVYETGRDLFIDELCSSEDILSSSPLEAAYYWSLVCISSNQKCLKFTGRKTYNFKIKCQHLVPDRLFVGTDSSAIANLSFLKKGVFYYADEKGDGKASHPIGDLFFVTNDNQLVLIDITGGQGDTVKDKVVDKVNWINSIKNHRKMKRFSNIFVVILAPYWFNPPANPSPSPQVIVSTGNDAEGYLGGLIQIADWYSPTARNNATAVIANPST
jgi:hypothetical protein